MALQADGIHIGLNQQTGIRAAVCKVTGGAAFGFNWGVFKSEWPGGRSVAFGADLELPCGRRQRAFSESAVRVMAICAVD